MLNVSQKKKTATDCELLFLVPVGCLWCPVIRNLIKKKNPHQKSLWDNWPKTGSGPSTQ